MLGDESEEEGCKTHKKPWMLKSPSMLMKTAKPLVTGRKPSATEIPE